MHSAWGARKKFCPLRFAPLCLWNTILGGPALSTHELLVVRFLHSRKRLLEDSHPCKGQQRFSWESKPWTRGRSDSSSFWFCEHWAWIPQLGHTGASVTWRQWEILKEILKTRWSFEPQGKPHQEINYALISGLGSWLSPYSVNHRGDLQLDWAVLWRSNRSSHFLTKCKRMLVATGDPSGGLWGPEW